MPPLPRKLALNAPAMLCRPNGRTSAAEAMEANADDFDYLMRVMKRRPEEAWPQRKPRALKAEAAPDPA